MTDRDNQKANESITRQTESLRAMRQREDRQTEKHLSAYTKETQGYINAAANLDADAIRHLRNRGYSWASIAELTGRTVEELQAVKHVPTTICAYCNHTVPAPENDDEKPPAVRDDEAWAALAADHSPNCEWITTRAHRVNV